MERHPARMPALEARDVVHVLLHRAEHLHDAIGSAQLLRRAHQPATPSASARSARIPGTKRYSPPRVVTKFCCGARKNGRLPWIVILPVPDRRIAEQEVLVVAEAEDVAVVQPRALHALELARDARLEAHEHEAAVAAVVVELPSGSGGPYGIPRRIMRWRMLSVPSCPSASRGFERRMWAPSGQRRPSRSSP